LRRVVPSKSSYKLVSLNISLIAQDSDIPNHKLVSLNIFSNFGVELRRVVPSKSNYKLVSLNISLIAQDSDIPNQVINFLV
jgi:hypothetical protein